MKKNTNYNSIKDSSKNKMEWWKSRGITLRQPYTIGTLFFDLINTTTNRMWVRVSVSSCINPSWDLFHYIQIVEISKYKFNFI